ncbi:MAG TPA: hypothetical protein PLZ43_08035 [bacterium]|nr:hypothetical protein [bacterium]
MKIYIISGYGILSGNWVKGTIVRKLKQLPHKKYIQQEFYNEHLISPCTLRLIGITVLTEDEYEKNELASLF